MRAVCNPRKTRETRGRESTTYERNLILVVEWALPTLICTGCVCQTPKTCDRTLGICPYCSTYNSQHARSLRKCDRIFLPLSTDKLIQHLQEQILLNLCSRLTQNNIVDFVVKVDAPHSHSYRKKPSLAD